MENPTSTLEGAPGSRNTRRLKTVVQVGDQLGQTSARRAATPVSQGLARPSYGPSALHDVARALGTITPRLQELADKAQAQEDARLAAAGRLGVERGEITTLDTIVDEPTAYREGAAAALGESLAYDALGKLNAEAQANLDNPEWNFDQARSRILGETFGDPDNPVDATMVQNGLDAFVNRGQAVEAAYQKAMAERLQTDTRDTFLTNAAARMDALVNLPPDQRLDALQAEFGAMIADGRKLRLSMEDINNQRLFMAEKLAIESGDASVLDVFDRPDPNGFALEHHNTWGPEVMAARKRVASALAKKLSAENAVLALQILRDDESRLDRPYGMSESEVWRRVGLPKEDPRHLAPGTANGYINTIRDTNAVEDQTVADVATLNADGHIPDEDRLEAATNRLAAGLAEKRLPFSAITQVVNRIYSRHGRVPKSYRDQVQAGILSANGEVAGAAFDAYMDMRSRNRYLAEQLFGENTVTKARTWEAARQAGVPDDVIAAKLNDAAADFLGARQTFVANNLYADKVRRALKDLGLSENSVGTYTKVQNRFRDIAGALVAMDLTPELAISLTKDVLSRTLVSVGGDGHNLVDADMLPFGLGDPDMVDDFRTNWLAPQLAGAGLDPGLADEAMLEPHGDDVIVYTPDGAPIAKTDFASFSTYAWDRVKNELYRDTTREIITAVDANRKLQKARAETHQDVETAGRTGLAE